MGRVLPLLGLRAFTETGRLGSVTAAARVMGVTPGAVSQQIRLLEDRVGARLFERRGRTLRPTEAGARVLPALVRAFDQMEGALADLADLMGKTTLTITTVPSFAATWLVPRLGRFVTRHPGVEVRVEATREVVDLRRGRVDIAIRHGLGEYPGHVVTKLLPLSLVPVGSPALLDAGPPIRGPADCLRYPLLHDDGRSDWGLWLAAHGIADPRATDGTGFADDYLVLRAALAGQGLALMSDVYSADEVRAGRLRLALDLPSPTAFAYYVVTRPDTRAKPAIGIFVAWLLEEAAAP
ncbi:MAG: LysR family transcriptional regulator [Alphaproteobacteria bacterium]|nr:LysR family transcriptional regulator [Alphaproteobacteria bacterium]